MVIEYPPTKLPGSPSWFIDYDQAESLNEFCYYFRDEDFDDRYFSQFDWFKDKIPQPTNIVNVGCATGRETFALMWELSSSEALGVDIDKDKISSARRMAQFRHWFQDEVLISVRDPRGVEALQEWNEKWVPLAVRKDVVPKFVRGDISDRAQIPRPDGYCDLVYCCNVLDFLVNENKDWDAAIRNLAALAKPATGRVVVVGATKRDSTQDRHSKRFMSHDDFRPYFEKKGLELIAVEEMAGLGHINSPTTNPRGYVYGKPG